MNYNSCYQNLGFDIVCDRVTKNRPYPALARHQARPYTVAWRQFSQHWPWTVPLDLHDYCQQHHVRMTLHDLESQWPKHSVYAVALGWFDFTIDYFDILPSKVFASMQQQDIKVLFFYHEGDNPHAIKTRLDSLVKQHKLPANCYVFVSANTAADNLENFVYFCSHEVLYWSRNQNHAALTATTSTKSKKFTVLNRTHKWWRATVMADLKQLGILNHSYWSYGAVVNDDQRSQNPIEEDVLELRHKVDEFLYAAPYGCDDLDQDQHNDHTLLVPTLFQDSYVHVVIETHFDADQSGGTFLTEKTFKPIKHGQPFVIAGPPGSVAQIKSMGYRTFDNHIDHSYDQEFNNTRRWQLLRQELVRLNQVSLDQIYKNCHSDIIYNQDLFQNSKQQRLLELAHKINATY